MTKAWPGGAMRGVLGAVASLLLVCAIVSPAAAATAPDRATLARMDGVIRDGMGRSGMPGFAVAVVSGDDVVHTRGFGDASAGRRVTPQTPFLLGSTSKSFTALAAMQLVDAGRLDLDAPARRYVREFRLADQRAADGITVRQVLQQTTGLPVTAGGPIVRSAVDGTALEALHELRGTMLATPPGTAFEYSNGNYILAGLIIERASGEPYAQYIQRHIFTPLGMRHSYVALDAAKRDGLAAGHRYWFGLATAHGPTFRAGIQSAGYLMSSAQDMGRYLAMYLNDGVAADGQRIVSRRGLATMLTPGRPGKMGAWSDHADARYAMGWYVGGPWSEPAQLHPGRAPDSSAMIVMFPRRDLAVVTLTNAANDLTLPGYPAAVDRVERNAIDALIGDPIDAGTSLHRYYLYVDLIALVLLAAVAWPLGRAVRASRTRTRPRRRWLAIAGVVTRAAGGVLLVALPALAFGWRASFLWQPDVFTLIVLLGALLLLTAALRLARLLRRSPESPPGGPVPDTVPAETAPTPALIAR
jgi:CubicO group peptidase (beta-lactamase class C family)